jgi:uncharacterized protein YlxW (UPF0749 family)
MNLVTIIKDMEKEIKSQEDQILSMRNQLDELQNQKRKGKLLALQQEMMTAKINAGLTPVAGKGIEITVDDNKEGLLANPNDDPNNYVVHQDYILYLVNELKRGGAEAIAVNGQRLISTSEIRCVGNVILINMTRLAPPYVIQAIGGPKLMTESVSIGTLDLLKRSNYPVSLQEKETIIIPAYKGDLQFKYASSL